MKPALLSLLLTLGLALTGCAGTLSQSAYDNTQVFTKIYLTDYNTAWQAVLDALKASPLDVSNREGGFIQTRWVENTAEKNFKDSFGDADSYLKAQYRLKVNVIKGFYNGVETVKVSVQKEQMVQHDVLEGWVPIETDSIDENTFLYRIGRIVYIRMKIAKLEDERAKKAMENTQF